MGLWYCSSGTGFGKFRDNGSTRRQTVSISDAAIPKGERHILRVQGGFDVRPGAVAVPGEVVER